MLDIGFAYSGFFI